MFQRFINGIRSAIVVLAIFLTCSFAVGQAYQAVLTGSVTDPSHALVPNATVTVTNLDTGVSRVTKTNGVGIYFVAPLLPGRYRLDVRATGFKSYTRTNISLQVAQNANIDVPLQIGTPGEVVTVTTDRPLLNDTDGSKGSVMNHEEVQQLPLETRTFQDLAFLTPGVIPVNDGGLGSFANISGARATSINFLLDGGDNNDLDTGAQQVQPPLESIQEFKVETSSYSAEYGKRNSGVINVAIMSGTNQFHGSLYEFHRNAAVEAANYFDTTKPHHIRNNYGASLGGPIHRDRLFFFINYEGYREVLSEPRLMEVPTAAEKSGDFSADATIIDPLTGLPFPNNQIPSTRFDGVARQLLQFYPDPNRSGPNNYATTEVRSTFDNTGVAKVTYNLHNGDSVALGYILNNDFAADPYGDTNLPGFGIVTPYGNHLANVNFSHIFTKSLISQTLFTFSRSNFTVNNADSTQDHVQQLGISGISATDGYPQWVTPPYATVGDSLAMPIPITTNNYSVNESMTWVLGHHNIKIGGNFTTSQYFERVSLFERGWYLTTGFWTGNAWGDFLLGLPILTQVSDVTRKDHFYSKAYAGYVQDDWKIRQNLTLNLGLRYDNFRPPVEQNNQFATFNPVTGSIVYAGESAYPRSVVSADNTNTEPRIGFAWKPYAGGKTVLRGGGGLFNGLETQQFLESETRVYPFYKLDVYTDFTQPYGLTFENPRYGTTSPSGNPISAFQLHPKNPLLYEYNLTIEQDLKAAGVLELSYVGSKGSHLGRNWNINQAPRIPGCCDLARPYPSYGDINYLANEANSVYHSLQVTLRKHTATWDYTANYTWSKSIDNSSQQDGQSLAGYFGAQDSYDLNGERALSDFDRRHAITGNITWRPAYGHGKNGVGHRILRDWETNIYGQYYTGTPITPQVLVFNYDAGQSGRPDRIGSGKLAHPSPTEWFNTADFVPVHVGAFRFGDSGRNILTGPSRRTLDASLIRYFKMSDTKRLQFRWEVFNVLNTPNFYLPSPDVDQPTGGAITQAYDPRMMQFALKFEF